MFFRTIQDIIGSIDWLLFGSALLLTAAGLVTMNAFSTDNFFFSRQLVWIGASVIGFFLMAAFDAHTLRRTGVIMTLFFAMVLALGVLMVAGKTVLGAKSRFDLGFFSFQPADVAQVALILVLAKYFSRRHVEIAHIRHIAVSGAYAFSLFALLFFQPDFGDAMIIFCIWLGMVLVAGISKKHLMVVFLLGTVAFSGLWVFAFQPYQKQRILTFVHPLTDIRGAGYNAYQSTIAVGSGGFWGKGVGYGTQSKLSFLPEYETDFIFAAFAEEWGFVGVCGLFVLMGVLLWRIIKTALHGASNFEMLFGAGLTILFMSHFLIHIGMNTGALPVTGITMPFMSYGGSHLITEFGALGILMSMHRYRRTVSREEADNEFLGV